jgi:hypothetical protein
MGEQQQQQQQEGHEQQQGPHNVGCCETGRFAVENGTVFAG